MNRKNYESRENQPNHQQKYKLSYVIRNTGTGAYLCDSKLNTRIFPTYEATIHECQRLGLSKYSYEPKVVVVTEKEYMGSFLGI